MEQSINDIRFVSSEKYEELKDTGNPSTQYIIDPKDLTLKSDLESFKSSVIKKDKKPDFLWTPVFRFKTSSDVTVNTDIEIQVSPFSTQIKSTHPDGNDIVELAPGAIDISKVSIKPFFMSSVKTIDNQRKYCLRYHLELQPDKKLSYYIPIREKNPYIPIYLHSDDSHNYTFSNKIRSASSSFDEYMVGRQFKITEEEALDIPASWSIDLSGNLFSSPIYFTKEINSGRQNESSMTKEFQEKIDKWKQKNIDLLTSANNKFKLNYFSPPNMSDINIWTTPLNNDENVVLDYRRIDSI